MKQLKHKKIWFSLLILILLVCMLFVGAGFYFFNLACVPGHKSFINNSTYVKKSDPLYTQKMWYKKQKKQKWYMTSATDNYRLDANYIPDQRSNKTVIILHGYMNNKDKMGAYAALFHRLGYNVLMPDARAQGQSQGKYIGYGWPERCDVKKWTNKLLTKEGRNQKVVLFGVSMGAATAMMTSGLNLPKQVKAIIEDCGYTDVKDEIEHEAKVLYHMPAFPRFPLVEILSGINRIKVGYYLKDGSSVNQLRKNHRPMLFIHGGRDKFVPTRMVYTNYEATKGKKELWIAKKAPHAASYANYPQAYTKHVRNFLNKYVH